MKKQTVLILAGLGILAYYLYSKSSAAGTLVTVTGENAGLLAAGGQSNLLNYNPLVGAVIGPNGSTQNYSGTNGTGIYAE